MSNQLQVPSNNQSVSCSQATEKDSARGCDYLLDGQAPVGWRLVSEEAVEHPDGGYGALIQNDRSGVYRLYSNGASKGINADYAYAHADLGSHIKALRVNAGFSQAELAKQLGLSKTAVAAWEQGISIPATRSLTALQLVIGLPLDDV